MSKSKKSVFNRPIREVKKPAKKIPVKKKKPSPVQENQLGDIRYKASFAIDHLRLTLFFFKQETGEQDVSRARLNQFLVDLEEAINRISAAL